MVDGFKETYIHFAESPSPDVAEQKILNYFRAAVEPSMVANLHDAERIAPFANVDVAKHLLKRHGLTNYMDRRTPKRSSAATESGPSDFFHEG